MDYDVAAGENHLENARKMVTKSKIPFFSTKPDYEGAAGEFEKAGKCFKNDPERAISCFVYAADNWHIAGSAYQAAKQMQQAATFATRAGLGGRTAADLLVKAADYYTLSQNDDSAAETMGKAARAAEDSDAKHALYLYKRCIEMWQQENRNSTAIDPIKLAIVLSLRHEWQVDTVEIMETLAASYSASKNAHGLSKASLSLIIYFLHIDCVERANREFEKCRMTRDEMSVGSAILEAYSKQDADMLTKAVAMQAITFLDQPIIRLARGLAIHVVATPATVLPTIPGFQPATEVVAADGTVQAPGMGGAYDDEDLC